MSTTSAEIVNSNLICLFVCERRFFAVDFGGLADEFLLILVISLYNGQKMALDILHNDSSEKTCLILDKTWQILLPFLLLTRGPAYTLMFYKKKKKILSCISDTT